MSVNSSPNRRDSASSRNAYFIMTHASVSNENIKDPEYNRNYLTVKPQNKLNVNLSASEPNLAKCVNQSTNLKSLSTGNKNNTDVNSERQSAKTDDKSGEKILTGMDRYITITKRKSSPRASKLEPTPKQAKHNAISQNRFSILDNQDEKNETSAKVKTVKPPPLYLREATTNTLVNKLTNIVGKEKYYVVSLRKGNIHETKIQLSDENSYRKVVHSFDAEGKNYYTYQLKSAKGLIVVVKGIDSSVPTNDIKEALESEGYEIKSIHNILNRNKTPQPLFRVEVKFNSSEIKKKGDTHPIYGLRYLLNRKIVIEEPIKRKGPPQCQNCQEFGHTKSFCKLPSVCVRCGDVHKTVDCPHDKSNSATRKCSNCGENHTANYRGCRVFLELKNKTTTKKSAFVEYRDSYFPSLRKPLNEVQRNDKATTSSTPPSAKRAESQNPTVFEANNNNFSYAHALKEGINITSSKPENSIEKLIQAMNNFMATMQNMVQQMLQNQSILMQILAGKK